MQYKELNLKLIREEANLDFAHYTYKRGMCSCCYSPLHLSKKYWRGGVLPKNKVAYKTERTAIEDVQPNEYTYLLFRNADNGLGSVTQNDEIGNVNIEWGFPLSKLDLVCKLLQEQLGKGYKVIKPTDHTTCIKIQRV